MGSECKLDLINRCLLGSQLSQQVLAAGLLAIQAQGPSRRTVSPPPPRNCDVQTAHSLGVLAK